MQTLTLHLNQEVTSTFLSERSGAFAFREKIRSALLDSMKVELDFTGIDTTQSYIDELFGRLLLELGGSILSRISFKGCNEQAKAVIKLVVSARLSDLKRLKENSQLEEMA